MLDGVQGRATSPVVVVQGATALTGFNRRTVDGIQSAKGWPLGRGWVPRGRHAQWPMGFGESEVSPMVRNRLDASDAPMREGCNGRAQRLLCQDVLYHLNVVECTTTHILQSALSLLVPVYYATSKNFTRILGQIGKLDFCRLKFVIFAKGIKRVSASLLIFCHD